MKRRTAAARPAIGLPIALLALLAGCGGGGNSSEAARVPEATVQVTGRAVDGTGAPIPGTEVIYQYDDNSSSALTNGDGKYDLRLPASQVGGIQNPAICVVKDGFESQLITFPTFAGGQNYQSDVTMAPLAANVSIPQEGQCLWHLGDGNFIGDVNRELQKATDGPVKAFPIQDWSAKVATGLYTKVRIVMQAKGWQTDTCPNSVSLLGAASGQEATLPGGDSGNNSGWAPYIFEFDIAAIGPTSASVVITAGACLDNDLDDFEFMQMRAEFI
jgi:hypothetical protein